MNVQIAIARTCEPARECTQRFQRSHLKEARNLSPDVIANLKRFVTVAKILFCHSPAMARLFYDHITSDTIA